MPKKLEEALKKEADKKGLTGDRRGAYIYGTIRRVDPSWEPSHAKKGGKSRKG